MFWEKMKQYIPVQKSTPRFLNKGISIPVLISAQADRLFSQINERIISPLKGVVSEMVLNRVEPSFL